jgi:hypothetical protein
VAGGGRGGDWRGNYPAGSRGSYRSQAEELLPHHAVADGILAAAHKNTVRELQLGEAKEVGVERLIEHVQLTSKTRLSQIYPKSGKENSLFPRKTGIDLG